MEVNGHNKLQSNLKHLHSLTLQQSFFIFKDATVHSPFITLTHDTSSGVHCCLKRLNLLSMHVVMTAVLEAKDIELHLRPLRRLISNLEERTFPKVDALLPALFHSLCLIWSHSRYYCTPQRMVVLLQEFCNLIVDKVCICWGRQHGRGESRRQSDFSCWRTI